MAKNAIKKKERIAHNKTPFNGSDEVHEWHDIVSTIIQGMDNNDLPDLLNKSEANSSKSNKTIQNKMQNNSTCNQNTVSIPKSKKFGLSRKFPLMEKSQRALKQIRHNRKMPKPRAHLAGLCNSPPENISPPFDNSVLAQKSKKKNTVAKNANKSQSKKIPKDFVHSAVTNECKMKGRSIGKSIDKEIVSKKPKPSVMKKNCSAEEFSHSLKKKCDKTVDYSSDSDQYEKFIQKAKKGLPKKSKNKKDNSKKSLKPSKEVSKKRASKTIKYVSSESDSDTSDVSASSKSYYKKSKRVKRSHEVVNNKSASPEKSESEMDTINDETYHDSSSEAEDLPSLSEVVSSKRQSGTEFFTQTSYKHNSLAELSSSSQKISDIASSAINKGSGLLNDKLFVSCTTSDIASLKSNDQPSVLHETSSISLNTKYSTVLPKPHDIASQVCHNQPISICSSTKNDSVLSSSSRQDSSKKSVVVDLTESDNECDNSFTVMPKIIMTSGQIENDSQSESGESDVELLDVIVPELLNKSKCANKNAGSNSSNDDSTSKLSIKSEKVDQSPSCSNTKPQNTLKSTNELQTSINNKHEVMYSTGICHRHDEDSESKYKIATQINLTSNKLQSNIVNNVEDCVILNKVKEEPFDDCEIVHDTASTSNSTQSLSNAQVHSNASIKIEKDSKAAKQATAEYVTTGNPIDTGKKLSQKLHEVTSSKFKDLTDFGKNMGLLEKKVMADLDDDAEVLLQELKQAFVTYQEILHTEQSVEATFKLLEKCQAEKLVVLKSKITKCLEVSSGNSKNCSSIKNAVSKLLDSPALNSSRTLKGCANVPSVCSNTNASKSDISLRDLKTFATMNIVPLSSISEKDIKPNLSDLQGVVKQEASTSDEMNNMSFGEKCIVCSKDASAACQQCAKVFYCSDTCGKKYWEGGHRNACAK